METRKVQVTGGSTYTVSLPKQWAKSNGISGGSIVEFYPEEDSLLLTPRQNEEKVEGTLDIGELEGEELTRTVVTMYVSGFDVITLETARVSAAQRRTIREATQGLVGLEVIGETSEHVQLQDLLDSSELSMHNAITRMRLVSSTMLSDDGKLILPAVATGSSSVGEKRVSGRFFVGYRGESRKNRGRQYERLDGRSAQPHAP